MWLMKVDEEKFTYKLYKPLLPDRYGKNFGPVPHPVPVTNQFTWAVGLRKRMRRKGKKARIRTTMWTWNRLRSQYNFYKRRGWQKSRLRKGEKARMRMEAEKKAADRVTNLGPFKEDKTQEEEAPIFEMKFEEDRTQAITGKKPGAAPPWCRPRPWYPPCTWYRNRQGTGPETNRGSEDAGGRDARRDGCGLGLCEERLGQVGSNTGEHGTGRADQLPRLRPGGRQ
ncbi:hypothetical protein PENTCL1PPCAC_8292 [Pristionchus entomophagus]|uniref:Ribosomal protein n=1 Tax=Pristionchus entomophagus TaxID=358040 RepID=A0AAV5SUK7_9BILA|nr:hypothetical protein PENTCL1PPCAC_8292 [Pristionchus entomophagus]